MMTAQQKSRCLAEGDQGETAAHSKRYPGDQPEVTDEYTSQYDAEEAPVMTTIEARQMQHQAALRRADERAAERELKKMLKNPVIGDSQEVAFSGRSFKRLLAWGIMLLLLVPLLIGFFGGGGPAFANEEAEEAEEDEAVEQTADEISGYSFYEMSAQMAGLFSDSTAPGGPGIGEDDETGEVSPMTEEIRRNAGSAGSFVGYLDPTIIDEGFSTWLSSQLSASSASISYDSLIVDPEGDMDAQVVGDSLQGFHNFALFGASLDDMGFSSTSAGYEFIDVGNTFMGGLMWIAWVLSYIVDFVFWLFVEILVALNPATYFYYGVHAISPELADGMTGGAGGQDDLVLGVPDNSMTGGSLNITIPDALSGIVSWIGDWYEILYDISTFVMVPMFIGFFIIGAFLFRKFDKGSGIRKLLVRLVFIVFGLPILGSMYSATLSSMSEGLNPGSTGSTQVVLSTYVDFENWANQHRLAVPNDATIEWDREAGGVTTATLGDLRRSALEVNSLVHGDDFRPLNSDFLDSDNADWSQAQMDGMDGGPGTGENSESNFDIVSNLITRAIFAENITASSWETMIKARAAEVAAYEGGGVDDARLTGWFDQAEGDGDDEAVHDNPFLSISTDYGSSGPGLRTPYDESGNIVMFQTADSTLNGDCSAGQVWSSTGEPRDCNMAPLAMFNLLNSSYDANSLTVYGSNLVSSEFTRQNYSSVTSVGTGVLGFVHWTNSMALLVSFILIGLTYAFAMLFGALKRTFQVVGNIPFATLGALGAIGKVIVYFAALVIQVLGTILLYMFIQAMLISLPSLIEAPFSALMEWAGDGVLSFFAGSVITILTVLLSVVALIAFTIMALKMRGSVMKAFEEAVSKVVEKLTGSSAGGSSGPGALSRAGQGALGGAGAGAGAAAANRAIAGQSANRSGTGGHSSSGQRNAPSKISTAGAGGTGALAGLSKDELRKQSEANGGSPDPNSENYDKNHPDAPDYDPAVAGEQGHVAETDPEAQEAQDGDGKTESRYQGGEIAESDEQMQAASEDQEEGQRVEREGLSLNGEAPQEYATAADQPEREDSAGEGLATDVQQGTEDALHDERSTREQAADIASSGKDYAAGTGHALIGNESGAAEKGADGEAKITGEGAHSESPAERSQLDQRHSEGADSETRSAEQAYGEGQHTTDSQREVQAREDATHEQRTDKDGNQVPGPVGADAAGTTTAATALDKDGKPVPGQQKLGPDGKPLPGQKPGGPSHVIGGDVKGGTANVDASSSQRTSVAESASHTDRSSTAQSQSVDQSQRSDSTVNQAGQQSAPTQAQPRSAEQSEKKPGRISATAQGTAKGAAKGAAAGAAVGLVGGPKGAAAGAKVGAAWGARSGATGGAVHKDASGTVNPLNRRGRKALGKSAKTGKTAGKPPKGPRPQQAPKPPAPAPAPQPPRNDGSGPGGDQQV